MSRLFPACHQSVILCSVFLAACATSESAPISVPEPVQEVLEKVQDEPEQVVSPAGPIGGIAFPELQGTWVSGCRLMSEGDPEEGFETTTVIVSGNDFTSDTTVFSDAGCNNRLERGFLQSGDSFQMSSLIARPGGSVDTAAGPAPFIDIDPQAFTIDKKPLSADLKRFMPLDVEYNIVLVEGSAMYLGESSDSAQMRPTALILDKQFVKQ